jgi:hypothetical protein
VVEVPFCTVVRTLNPRLSLLKDFENNDLDFQNDGSAGSFFSRANGFSPAFADADMP